MIAVFFYHKTTRAPWIGLSPTATGVNLNSNVIVVNGQAMTESVLPWWYTHPYNLDSEINYAFTFEPNNPDYIYAFKEAFIPARGGGWGGFSVNMSGVTGSINNLTKLVREEGEKTREHVTTEHNETKSRIDIAKWEINDKIESIEIPETVLEEKEAKKTQKMLDKLDKKILSYIDSEKTEKEEIMAFIQEQKAEQERMLREKEEEDRKEEETMKQIEEEVKAEFDKQESEEKEEKRKEIEKELEEIKKEKTELEMEQKEKEKELNSLL